MLESMRKHMTWMMWIIVALITVAFLFFGISPSDMGSRNVAKVGEDAITQEEFNRVYRNLYDTYRELLKDKFDEAMAKNLRSQALQELVVQRLLVQEAARVGLKVTDEELQSAIMRMPSFVKDGKFDKKVYDRVLTQINMSPSAFEASQRDFLVRQKLEQLIKDGVMITDTELAAAYKLQNPNAKPGEIEKNRETFRQAQLAEKRKDAMTAFVRIVQGRTTITIDDKAISL